MDHLALLEICRRLTDLPNVKSGHAALAWVLAQDWDRQDHKSLEVAFLEVAESLDTQAAVPDAEGIHLQTLLEVGHLALDAEPGLIDELDKVIESIRLARKPLREDVEAFWLRLIGLGAIIAAVVGGACFAFLHQRTVAIVWTGILLSLGTGCLLRLLFGKNDVKPLRGKLAKHGAMLMIIGGFGAKLADTADAIVVGLILAGAVFLPGFCLVIVGSCARARTVQTVSTLFEKIRL